MEHIIWIFIYFALFFVFVVSQMESKIKWFAFCVITLTLMWIEQPSWLVDAITQIKNVWGRIDWYNLL